MSVTYGFYDSYNGDRVYNAEQFSSFYDGLINDGVYYSVGQRFHVSVSSGMDIFVDTGRAWFDHTWTFNNQKLLLTVPSADTVYARIDAVVIEINKSSRENSIKIVQGSPSSSPGRPSLSKTDYIKQYALAYITVPANATSIQASNITNVVGEVETPMVSMLNISGLPPMQWSTTDIVSGSTPLYTGTLYLVYE